MRTRDAETFCAERLGISNARGHVAQRIAGSWRKLSPGALDAQDLCNTPVEDIRFWVVDVETNGGPAGEGRLIELAAVEVQHMRPGRRFTSLVRPEAPLPEFITRLTGITDRMLSEAPEPSSIMPVFLRLIGGGVFVAHPAGFDWKFIARENDMMAPEPLQMPMVCNLKLARRIHPEMPDHKLDTLAARHRLRFERGGSPRARHRALGDALVTAAVFMKFLRRLRKRGVTTFGDLKRFEKLPLKKAWEIMET